MTDTITLRLKDVKSGRIQRLACPTQMPISQIQAQAENLFKQKVVGMSSTFHIDSLVGTVFKNGDILEIRLEEHRDAAKQANSVDAQLDTKEARVERQRDSQMCRHGPLGRCEHCLPLDSWDQRVTKDSKYLSYHNYLRKCQDEKIQLEQPCFVTPICTQHAPYPQGICSRCQIPPISLASQPFRMVDHVEFVSAYLMESFLGRWRQSGGQRQVFGWMLGEYGVYEGSGVPLGLKAIVHAIYAPSQQRGYIDGIKLELETEPTELALALGLQVVGMIWTDLNESNEVTRDKDTYFVSGPELMMMARMQNKHPYEGSPGRLGSRFFTAVLTHNHEEGITVECYQV